MEGALVGKAMALIAGLLAALLTSGEPVLTTASPALKANGGHDLFAGAGVLAPGGTALVRDIDVTFSGQGVSREAGLYFSSFTSRGAGSQPTCTAADPGGKFNFTVGEGGRLLYDGTLEGFAAAHHDPQTMLPLAGRGGILDRWAPGDSVLVELSVALDASADDSLMGCITDTQFAWFAD